MVRIAGDSSFIVATIEAVKVVAIAITVSVLTTLDNVWCMYSLRRHGEVTLYENDFGNVAMKIFKALWRTLISLMGRKEAKEFDKSPFLEPHEGGYGKLCSGKRGRISSVRTGLLLISIAVSLVDFVILFALSVEGKEIADKAEFAYRSEVAEVVQLGSKRAYYNPHEAQIRYEYVLRRLNRRMAFVDGNEFTVDVPRSLDVVKDEKWTVNVPLTTEETYATVHIRDFISNERAAFSQMAEQVTGITESGKRLVHYIMAQRDKVRKACSGSMGAAIVGAESSTFCYTDELRDMSCENVTDGEILPFSMKCSELRVERFGQEDTADSMWWLTSYANGIAGVGKNSLMQMVSLRGYRRDQVSPSSMIVAALLTEYPSQSVLVERPFAEDVSVVILPNWLLAASAAILAVMIFLGAFVSVYAAVKNLVILTHWQELLIANVLDPLDGLNRANKKEFRCLVSESHDSARRYQLYVEPELDLTPVSWVKRNDIG